MSDPVTNVAIEDVLSSIRRLVSEDARVRPFSARDDDSLADKTSSPEPSAEMPGKLVLTPALRVADTDAEMHPEPAADSAPQVEDGPVADATAEQQDEAAQLQEHQHHAASDDGVEATGDTGIEDTAYKVTAAEVTADEDVTLENVADEEGISLAGIAPDATLASISEALAWEDHHEDEAADLSDVAARDDAAAMGASDDFDRVVVTPDAQPSQQVDTDTTQSAGAFVFATTRDNSGTADQGSEVAFEPTDAASGADRFDISGSDQDGPESLFADDDTILDEEMLRELVTDIVRQELQGALGERITRNVRKLVRREIHRALASHDLE